MAESLHPAATQHLPSFITAPGETDVLMVVMAGILLVAVLGFGILYLTLHSLPERIAHKSHKLQFEIVAVLGLISLFTHMHIFWIIGLVLALVDLPDFGGYLGRIAGAVEKMAGSGTRDNSEPALDETIPLQPEADVACLPQDGVSGARRSDKTVASKPEFLSTEQRKELSHA